MEKRFADKRALVIGAGIGGLSAAAALAAHFGQVIVLERDQLSSEVSARPGVPHGKHPHALLAGGSAALGELFPGLGSLLEQAGAQTSDAGADVRFELGGIPAPRRKLDIHTFLLSRPLLESVLLQQLKKFANVTLRDTQRVVEIVAENNDRAAGVCVETREGKREVLAASLVVDASGRGAPTLDFLKATGRPVPEETTVGIDLTYGSALYSFPPDAQPDFKVAITIAKAPERSRCGYIIRREGGLWDVLLAGRNNDMPPVDDETFLAFAQSLDTPTIFDALTKGRRESKILRFAFPESRRRHFSSIGRFPAGLLPLGDAVCRTNPVYGQGMTVAAQEALLLRSLLAASHDGADSLEELGSAFLAGIESLLEAPWAMAGILDLVYPQTRGHRPPDMQKRLEYQSGLTRLAAQDRDVQKLMAEVRHLLKPGSDLQTEELKRRVQQLQAATSS